MEKEKVLEIESQEVWDKIAVRIKYLDNEFFTGGFCKEDIEKYNCSMEESPYDDEECVLFLGDDIIISDRTIYCYTQEKIKEIKEFIDFINEKYGIPKRWRANEGECYYSVGGVDVIKIDSENLVELDNRRYESGNYFETEKEARKIINSKEWKNFWAKVRAGEIGGDE